MLRKIIIHPEIFREIDKAKENIVEFIGENSSLDGFMKYIYMCVCETIVALNLWIFSLVDKSVPLTHTDGKWRPPR